MFCYFARGANIYCVVIMHLEHLLERFFLFCENALANRKQAHSVLVFCLLCYRYRRNRCCVIRGLFLVLFITQQTLRTWRQNHLKIRGHIKLFVPFAYRMGIRRGAV